MNNIENIEKKAFQDETLSKKDWDSYKFKKSITLKYKLPNNFLEKINPNNTSNELLENYSNIIVNTKENKKTFKINFSLGLFRIILTIILLILDVSLLTIEDQLNNKVIELFLPVFVLFILIFLTWEINTSFFIISSVDNSWFNNYKLHVEYYRCKFAIKDNKKTEVNSIEHIRKYFNCLLYKFVDEKKLNFLNDSNKSNKTYSKFYVLFTTYWFVIADLVFALGGSLLIFILTALHVFGQI